MTSCGGSCGIGRAREREREAALRAVERAFPGRIRARSPRPGASHEHGPARLAELGRRLEEIAPVRAFACPAEGDDECDWLYLLVGLHDSSLLELCRGVLPEGTTPHRLGETYVRVGLSRLGPFATLQEVTLSAEASPPVWLVSEEARVGVEDPRLAPLVKGLQGALRQERLSLLDAAFLISPLEGARWAEGEGEGRGEPLVWSFVFEPSPPHAGRSWCVPG